jgi:Zn-dependent protease
MHIEIAPRPTPYDWLFRVGKIPVRVHPFFWLTMLVLGYGDGNAVAVIVWLVAAFISVLAHELGHAWTMQHYGGRPRVVLYYLGGLAMDEASTYDWLPTPSRSTREMVLIALAGPAAGFVLALGVILLIVLSGGSFYLQPPSPPLDNTFWEFRFPEFIPMEYTVVDSNGHKSVQRTPLVLLVDNLLSINIVWGLINLLPIFPLDGGQVVRELWQAQQGRNGLLSALQLSSVTAAIMAVLAFVLLWDSLLAIMFIMLGVSSYHLWQQVRAQF